MISETEQMQIIKQMTLDQCVADAKEDSDDFKSAEGGDDKEEDVMRFDAEPFKPVLNKEDESHPDAKEVLVQTAVNDQLRGKLDKQILVMKAQHQYIQNLQRANIGLKARIKQLEDVSEQSESLVPAMQGDIEEQEDYCEMEMQPVGTIEKVSKAAYDERDKENHHRQHVRGPSKERRQGHRAHDGGDRRGGANLNWDAQDCPTVPEGFWEAPTDMSRKYGGGTGEDRRQGERRGGGRGQRVQAARQHDGGNRQFNDSSHRQVHDNTGPRERPEYDRQTRPNNRGGPGQASRGRGARATRGAPANSH